MADPPPRVELQPLGGREHDGVGDEVGGHQIEDALPASGKDPDLAPRVGDLDALHPPGHRRTRADGWIVLLADDPVAMPVHVAGRDVQQTAVVPAHELDQGIERADVDAQRPIERRGPATGIGAGRARGGVPTSEVSRDCVDDAAILDAGMIPSRPPPSERVEQDVGGVVAPGGLDAVANFTARGEREALFAGRGAAGAAARPLELRALVRAGGDAGVQGEAAGNTKETARDAVDAVKKG